jgi:hypothetical protein
MCKPRFPDTPTHKEITAGYDSPALQSSVTHRAQSKAGRASAGSEPDISAIFASHNFRKHVERKQANR